MATLSVFFINFLFKSVEDFCLSQNFSWFSLSILPLIVSRRTERDIRSTVVIFETVRVQNYETILLQVTVTEAKVDVTGNREN